jgi:hypothetical protein
MVTQRSFIVVLAISVLALLVATNAKAQSTGIITGLVTDDTGGVLPGVTVEASSPALIEGIRTAATDSSGRYRIEALQPGTYTVTFRLGGFGTFVREGIVLTTGFTATVNAKLGVGGLEEKLTVTGASPLVDVQNVNTQQTLSRQTLDTVPTGKTWAGYAALTVGLQPSIRGDVGGSKGDVYAFVSINGSRSTDGAAQMDGLSINDQTQSSGGTSKHFIINQAAIQEVVIATAGSSVDQQTGGVIVNNVPRDGGNRFSFYTNLSGTSGDLQNSNLDDTLRQRGVRTQSQLKKIYDFQFAGGGPIFRDQLWFYTAHRKAVTQEYSPFSYYNKLGYGFAYEPDLSRPGFTDFHFRDHSGRLTWQLSSKDKIGFFAAAQDDCQCHYWVQIGGSSADASFQYGEKPKLFQWTWTRPHTSNLLFSAGFSRHPSPEYSRAQPGMPASAIGIFEISQGIYYNTRVTGIGGAAESDVNVRDNMDGRFAASYITGTHSVKVGVSMYHGIDNYYNVRIPHDISYTFNNGAPVSLTQWATPSTNLQTVNMLGLYAQDQWTVKRLTLNLGLRFDYLNAYVPAQTRPAGQFVQELRVARVDNVPNWKDINPRLGVAYDLRGDGRTAVKASLGRYVTSLGTGTARMVNPANAIVQSSSRTWDDSIIRNFVPDCDLRDSALNNECGAGSDAAFGTVRVTQTLDPALLDGFAVREYQWQGSVGIGHELRPGWATDVTYHRTQFGNFQVTDNLLVGPQDYDPYSFLAPVDPRLPGGGGYLVSGLYDVKLAKFGQSQRFITSADKFGDQKEFYNGVAVNVTGRVGEHARLGGGINVGQVTTDRCFVVDSPEEARPGFCRVQPPWSAGTDVKFNGSYQLPLASTVSWVFQNLPGTTRTATYSASNAEIALSLGRDLSSGPTGRVNVAIIRPESLYEKRQSQLDLRFTKLFKVRGGRVRGWVDLYNVTNANTILGVNGQYGTSWLAPTVILGGRLLKFGTQIDF